MQPNLRRQKANQQTSGFCGDGQGGTTKRHEKTLKMMGLQTDTGVKSPLDFSDLLRKEENNVKYLNSF